MNNKPVAIVNSTRTITVQKKKKDETIPRILFPAKHEIMEDVDHLNHLRERNEIEPCSRNLPLNSILHN